MASTASGATTAASAVNSARLTSSRSGAASITTSQGARSASSGAHATPSTRSRAAGSGSCSRTSRPGVARRRPRCRRPSSRAGDPERPASSAVPYGHGHGALQLGDDRRSSSSSSAGSCCSACTRRARAPTCSAGARPARPRPRPRTRPTTSTQMLAASNALRRRRGAPERTADDVADSVDADRRELDRRAREYRGGGLTWRAC